MSNPWITSIFRSFGRLHGLDRTIAQGGFLVRGIVLAAPLLPLKFLGIYTGLCFLFAAILEVPAGYVSDRFSYLKNFYLAQFFGFLSDVVFLAFVFALLNGQTQWSYLLCGLGAAFSGLGGALASGNNEVLFTQWYQQRLTEKKLDIDSAPNLFLGALWPGLKVRVFALIGLFAVSFASKEILWSQSASDVKTYALRLISGLLFLQIIYLLLAVKMFAKLESNQKSASHKLNMSSIKEGLALRKSWGSLVSIGTFILLVQILGVFLTSGAFRFLRPLTAGHTSGLEIEKWFVVSSGFATTLGVAVSSAFLSKYVKKERAFLAKSLPLARRIIIVGIICLSLLLKFGEHFNQWAFGSFYFALVVLCCTLSISCIGLLMWDFFTRTKVGLPATWLSLQSLLVSFGYFAFCQFGSLATDMNIYVAPLCAAGLLVVLIGFIPREQFGYESTANEKT